ncbi:MAG: hypothetical protein PHF86_09965 [Candidatus Nanoarchaeia archaeon]|nr:hypothetical protein [Candidatus Nanoarchaeia archaeon]
MKLNKKEVFVIISFITLLLFVNLVYSLPNIYSNDGTQYASVQACLLAINGTEEKSCILNQPNYVETLSKSIYNITGINGLVLSLETVGILKINQSNITLDFSGTKFVKYNRNTLSQYGIFAYFYNNINVTIKNLDMTDLDYAIINGWIEAENVDHRRGNSNWSLYNIKGNVKSQFTNYSYFENITGNILGTDNINNTFINCSGSISGSFYNSYIRNFNGTYITIDGENNTFINIKVTDESKSLNNIFYGSNITAYKIILTENAFLNNSNIGYIQETVINNVTITNTKFNSSNININAYDNWYLYNNSINNTNGNTCLFLKGNGSNIIDNSFYKCGNKSYNESEGWTYNETYIISNSTFTYNDINYNSCLLVVNSAMGLQRINTNNEIVNDPDGIVNYGLWLYTDSAGLLTCGVGSKVTILVASDLGLTCDQLPGMIGGTCDYNNTYAFEAKGYGNNYIWNTSIINATLTLNSGTTSYLNFNNGTRYINDSRFVQDYFSINSIGFDNKITQNTFYNETSDVLYSVNISENDTLWYNNFYEMGVNGGIGCYNNIGNYYQQGIPYSDMASGECGLINITSPSSQSSSNPIIISWTAQDSLNTINYILEYILNGVRTTIGSTTSLSYNWNVPNTDANYTINIIPKDIYTNGTNRNSTVLIKILISEETSTSSGSSGGGSSSKKEGATIIEGLKLENLQGFTTNIDKFSIGGIDELKTQDLEITNPSDNNLIIKIIPDNNLINIISISENYFLLKPKETKIISFNIKTKEPGNYKGIIKIVSDEYQKIINVDINVKPTNVKEFNEETQKVSENLKIKNVNSIFIWIGHIITIIISFFKELF